VCVFNLFDLCPKYIVTVKQSFLTHLVHSTALISDSMTLSQTSPEDVRPWTRNQRLSWCTGLLYQLTPLPAT